MMSGHCPFCGAGIRVSTDPFDYSSDFACGTIARRDGSYKREEECFEQENAVLTERLAAYRRLFQRLMSGEGTSTPGLLDELRKLGEKVE